MFSAVTLVIPVLVAADCSCGPFNYPAGIVPCPLVTEEGKKVDPNSPIHPEYPRPRMVRNDSSWMNLNGWWDLQPGSTSAPTNYTKKVLVPFPVESCLSGVWVTAMGADRVPEDNTSWTFHLWYRKVLPRLPSLQGKSVILHFGAVDWQTTVWVNGKEVGGNTGGYNPFSFDITSALDPSGSNEVRVYVYDPSDYNSAPYGKQRISAIKRPNGDTYTPSSGIWQTVWLEFVEPVHITGYDVQVDLSTVTITTHAAGQHGTVYYSITNAGGTVVATSQGSAGLPHSIRILNPILWSPDSPHLYTVRISFQNDVVTGYFGLRTFTIGEDSSGKTRPFLNGKLQYLFGWLDQSFWPDGLYTYPTDQGLKNELMYLKSYGYNFIRLHQKVNPERYYWYADTLGVVLFQDAPQRYPSHVNKPTSVTQFESDLKDMIEGKKNHPSIVQWTLFNEGDQADIFDKAQEVLDFAKSLDPTRLIDVDSGGPANDFHLGDVNDLHKYPFPPNATSLNGLYGMNGEFGGFGLFVPGHEWIEGQCFGYNTVSSSQDFVSLYVHVINGLVQSAITAGTSVSVYTQLSDVERECDGIYTYDRHNKFNESETAALRQANLALVNALSPAA